MSDEKIKYLSDKQREKNGSAISDAIRHAKQLVRNVGAEDLAEQEGLASGDMKKFLDNPEEYEQGGDDERVDDE